MRPMRALIPYGGRATGHRRLRGGPNDPDVMEQVYPRYLHAFRNKERAYRELLPPAPTSIELGPHLGGFLQSGGGMGLEADRSRCRIRHHCIRARQRTQGNSRNFRGFESKPGAFDAVFIWNCFEQLPGS